jgi:hypothetical protein
MTTTFLGIPVEGEITRGDKRAEQRPLAEFAPLMQAVLDDPLIEEFGWHQYTPYFNDGDPCVFSAYGAWVHTAEKTDSDIDDEEQQLDYHPVIGIKRWDEKSRSYARVKQTPEHSAAYNRVKELSDAIEGGHFDDVLLDAFGDHAMVIVKKDSITVEFYEHD